MPSTLIIYGTRKGTTTETVEVIADVLRSEFDLDVIVCEGQMAKAYRKRLDEFRDIIIGSSIVSGRWVSRVLSFARKNRFEGKNVAVFVTAGGTLNKVNKYGITKQQAVEEAIRKYIDRYLDKFRFTPVSKAAFGGKFHKKGVLKYTSWDRDDIVKWAREVGTIFTPDQFA